MPKISVVIITFNEEKNLSRCLDSVKEIADEIIIVDSYSTDKTQEIAQKYNTTFIQREFKGYGDQKNFALDQASNDYVLSLDADEVLSPKLIETIKNEDLTLDGYLLNRITNYVGHWVKHCGWYPDRKIRLINKNKGRWTNDLIHEYIKVDSPNIKLLKGDLLHYSYNSISDHITQTNKFTTISAKSAFKKGKWSNTFKILTRPAWQFFRDYIIKLGFLDGRTGFTICKINALSTFLKYSKIKELQMGKSID
jgi:glycosyltransferase involved in cell wall biosynthesis